MKIPPNCHAWRAAMVSGNDLDRAILRNLEDDHCIPADIEAEFFQSISDQDPPKHALEARSQAWKVTRARRDRFTLCGNPINPPFEQVFRIIPVEDLRHCFATPYVYSEALARGGILDESLKSLSDERVLRFIGRNEPQLVFGNQMGIVWVAPADELPDTPLLGVMVDRLGLVDWEQRERAIVFQYASSDIPHELRTPRVLDAIANSQFMPAPCASGCGRTRPLRSSKGLSEAIHKGCAVHPTAYALIR